VRACASVTHSLQNRNPTPHGDTGMREIRANDALPLFVSCSARACIPTVSHPSAPPGSSRDRANRASRHACKARRQTRPGGGNTAPVRETVWSDATKRPNLIRMV
jgi:hypothetical protein